MPIVGYILVVAGAYLLGSIPTGFLVARARGLDIRTVGSGNIGATNVMRQLGKAAGIFVLAADAAKGALAVGLAKWAPAVLHWPASPGAKEGLALAAGLAAVLGHNFTCWLRFKEVRELRHPLARWRHWCQPRCSSYWLFGRSYSP
jgi:glycerol-3-phosphate acyltransferase PlsY